MDARYISSGQTIEHTPGSDIALGDVVVLGTQVGVANRQIATGQLGVINVKGIHQVTKNTAEAIAIGTKVYWDDSNKEVVTDPTGNEVMGYAAQETFVADTTILVDLARA
ncbi:MAG: DUF2190 family protein [Planctomycetes bacterium]|nr:DUF2190 family protein [Planctomycetota bacterium]